MMLETKQLSVYPLTARQLGLWVNDLALLEQELGFTYRGEKMTGFFRSIVKGQIEIAKTDEKNYCFHSFWLLMLKEGNIVVGAADFKNIPNADGQVEIGYGLAPEFEHKGYMTEAVNAMTRWALEQPGVGCVIAETDIKNVPSHRVLERCGFLRDRKTPTSYWWRLSR